MTKIVVVSVIVVIALVALVVGVLWLPKRAPLQVTATTTTQSTQQPTTTTSQGVIWGGHLVRPVVDRNGFTGKNLRLSDFQGRVIVLEFMGAWCPPCEEAVTAMEVLYDDYADRGVVFVAVAVPWPASSHYQNVSIAQFLSEYKSSLTYVYDPTNELSYAYNVQGVPSVFVLSRNGTIYASFRRMMPIASDVAVSIDEALGYLPIALMQQADATGDTFNDEGQPVVADNYLDITEVAFGELGPTYVFNITVAGPLPPASSASTSVLVEWDVLLDLDQNNATHSWGPYLLIDNGIGVDALARLTWYNGSYHGQLWTWSAGRRTIQDTGFRVNAGVATIYVQPSMIQDPSGFSFVYAVRQYAEPGDTLVVADKAPNQGHLAYTYGSVAAAASLITGQQTYRNLENRFEFSREELKGLTGLWC